MYRWFKLLMLTNFTVVGWLILKTGGLPQSPFTPFPLTMVAVGLSLARTPWTLFKIMLAGGLFFAAVWQLPRADIPDISTEAQLFWATLLNLVVATFVNYVFLETGRITVEVGVDPRTRPGKSVSVDGCRFRVTKLKGTPVTEVFETNRAGRAKSPELPRRTRLKLEYISGPEGLQPAAPKTFELRGRHQVEEVRLRMRSP